MTVEIRKTRSEPFTETCEPADAARAHDGTFDGLMRVLRHPHHVFGAAAEPDVVARCELEDWEAIGAVLKKALDQHGASATDAMEMLRLAGEFLRHQDIRLDGSPWLCTHRDDEGFWICYRVHTSLSHRHLVTWEERLDDLLDSRGIDIHCFRLQFASAGPR
jgi:hypothetical protein